jgi:4-hydroxy-tetrahydrodipicolinate reductase
MGIRIGVFGAGGRMGIAVCNAVAEAAELDLVAAVDPALAGASLHEIAGVADTALVISASGASFVEAGVEVAIDFTHIDAARANLALCADAGIHAVVGTSGFTEKDHAEIATMFSASNCLIAPNFAIGAVLMMRFAEMAAPFFDTAEIIELHHDGKVDAPSGTAIATAERMAAASGEWAPDPVTTETIPGARGSVGPADIRVHSVRMRGMVAHQEVLLGTTGQTLLLRHDSYDRSSFMPGVVLAAQRIGSVPGLTIGLDGVLDL